MAEKIHELHQRIRRLEALIAHVPDDVLDEARRQIADSKKNRKKKKRRPPKKHLKPAEWRCSDCDHEEPVTRREQGLAARRRCSRCGGPLNRKHLA